MFHVRLNMTWSLGILLKKEKNIDKPTHSSSLSITEMIKMQWDMAVQILGRKYQTMVFQTFKTLMNRTRWGHNCSLYVVTILLATLLSEEHFSMFNLEIFPYMKMESLKSLNMILHMHMELTIKLNYEGDMRMSKTPAQKIQCFLQWMIMETSVKLFYLYG